MNDPRPVPASPFENEIDEYGVCRLQPVGKLGPEDIAAVIQSMRARIAQDNLPVGILLDVRNFPLLSAVRLASLIDALSELRLRLAVLVSDERQRQIIGLLHNTLEHKELVDYFTDWPTARAFVLHAAAANGAQHSPLGPAGPALPTVL